MEVTNPFFVGSSPVWDFFNFRTDSYNMFDNAYLKGVIMYGK
jgi:hypothetical protein